MQKTFWLLWNPEGRTPPTKRFDTFEEAAAVAENMQKRIGVGTMYIMKTVQSVTVSHQVKWEGFKEVK